MDFVLKCMAAWAACFALVVPTLGGIILWEWPAYWPGHWGDFTRLLLVLTTLIVGGAATAVNLLRQEKQK